MNKKISFTTYIVIILIIIFGVGFYLNQNSKIDKNNKILPIEIVKDKEEEIPKVTTIYFVGDMMLDRGVETSVNKNFGGDFSRLFENLGELKNSDILFGNLEGPVSDVGNNVGSIYSFRMDPKVLPVIKNAGFDIVSFANNHIGDWNINAFKDTLKRLDENGIKRTGAGINSVDAETPTIIEKNGIKFGFLGFSDVGPNWMQAQADKPGILLASDPRLPEIVKNAKAQSDVLIVSFHFGVEYKTVHNARQETLAHSAIDNGADMIIGHHPHVMEDREEYKGKPIIYSLGNFIFDQYFSTDTMRGMLYSATFEGATLKNIDTKIITLNRQYQPEGIFTKEEIKEKDDLASNICPKPTKEYDDMSLLAIGQDIVLPDVTYIPKDLREVSATSSTKKGICLSKETRDAFELMTEAARKDEITMKASSGFRSFSTQKSIFNSAISSGKTDTAISIAKLGYSEHQLGTAIDITGKSINYSSANGVFNKTPEDIWLRSNASIYGFVQSYPSGKEDITGYKYEPWHYRYVGIENAQTIKESGETLNQFLAK